MDARIVSLEETELMDTLNSLRSQLRDAQEARKSKSRDERIAQITKAQDELNQKIKALPQVYSAKAIVNELLVALRTSIDLAQKRLESTKAAFSQDPMDALNQAEDLVKDSTRLDFYSNMYSYLQWHAAADRCFRLERVVEVCEHFREELKGHISRFVRGGNIGFSMRDIKEFWKMQAYADMNDASYGEFFSDLHSARYYMDKYEIVSDEPPVADDWDVYFAVTPRNYEDKPWETFGEPADGHSPEDAFATIDKSIQYRRYEWEQAGCPIQAVSDKSIHYCLPLVEWTADNFNSLTPVLARTALQARVLFENAGREAEYGSEARKYYYASGNEQTVSKVLTLGDVIKEG